MARSGGVIRPSSFNPLFKGTGIPTFLSGDILAGSMQWYAVDTGSSSTWAAIVADCSPGHSMFPPSHFGTGFTDPDTTQMSIISSPFGNAINWQGRGVINGASPGSLGYVNSTDTIRTITDLSNGADGIALTMATSFYLKGTITDDGQVFGRPVNLDGFNFGCGNILMTGGSTPKIEFVWATMSNANPALTVPQVITGTTTIVTNTLYSVVATAIKNAATHNIDVNLYMNGNLEGSATGSTFFDHHGDNEDQIQFGTQYHAAAPKSFREINGSVFQGLYANRQWSAAEAADFANHPFRMLQF